jgi:hypothetical protein
VAGASKSATSRWWRHQRVNIPTDVYTDLQLLHRQTRDDTTLRTNTPTIWSRPIGLLIRRQHTAEVLSDASYGGLGGWCLEFRFFWRLLAPELVSLGFDFSVVQKVNDNLRAYSEHGTHIKILEFFAIAINVWLTLHFVRSRRLHQTGGHVVAIVANNTSALSWLRFAARNRASPIRRLALFVMVFSHSLRPPTP